VKVGALQQKKVFWGVHMRKPAELRLGLAIAVFVSVVAAADGIADPSSIKPAEHEVVPELPNLENVLRPLTAEGLTRTRQNLIRYVWKGLDPYKLKPSAVDSGARTGNIALVAAAADAKTIYVNFGENLSAFVEYAKNESSASCLTIWAQGHEGAPPNPLILPGAISYLTKQWARGCDLLIVPMPLRGESSVVINTPKEGPVLVQRAVHDALALIDTPDFSAFRLFFDPLFAAMNWLEGNGRRYSKITMAGISGGGWMSVVYPAIDTRITEAISVAGSLPMALKFLPTEGRFRDIGDWEQNYAPFYQIASFYELYLLSALGDGRQQTLVYNYIDPCCYSGSRAMAFLPQLERKANELRIDLTGFIDRSHDKHDFSEAAISATANREGDSYFRTSSSTTSSTTGSTAAPDSHPSAPAARRKGN
jgi:hypothetical protein